MVFAGVLKSGDGCWIGFDCGFGLCDGERLASGFGLVTISFDFVIDGVIAGFGEFELLKIAVVAGAFAGSVIDSGVSQRLTCGGNGWRDDDVVIFAIVDSAETVIHFDGANADWGKLSYASDIMKTGQDD